MKRIYLSTSGQERLPTPQENSHYGMARTILGPSWSGDTEDAYAEMWRRGWVRIVENESTVFGERYLNGAPVPLTGLTRSQRQWMEDKILDGKKLNWNDTVFESTREYRENAGDYRVLVDNQE